MSSDGSNRLARFRPTGWPTFAAPPPSTASTKLGWSWVPSSLLKTEMQDEPHSWVAAPAAPGAAAPTPPTSVSVATAVSTFLLIDSTWADDEVMTDLLSEDLTGCGLYGTKPARLVCPSRPCGPWSLPGVVVASPPGAGQDRSRASGADRRPGTAPRRA